MPADDNGTFWFTPAAETKTDGRNGPFNVAKLEIRPIDAFNNLLGRIVLGASSKNAYRYTMPPWNINLTPEDSLRLGIALIQAATGRVDSDTNQRVFDKFKRLIDERDDNADAEHHRD